MGLLMVHYGMVAPLRRFIGSRPVLGTCAGLVLLAARTTGEEQPLLGGLDSTAGATSAERLAV
jgi:5'-phosphate synthase pdxT subunit